MSTEKNIKKPRLVLPGIYAFSPNRETLGATAYFIVDDFGNILVDCPFWDETSRDFVLEQGGVNYIYLTHRGGIGKQIKQMQELFACQVIIQEQEAYLLPEIPTTKFEYEIELNKNFLGIWTSGYSPGSSSLYYRKHIGVLFTGRHLLPDPEGRLVAQRGEKTFHWPRQLKNVQALCQRFDENSLSYVCPGANTGYLRGSGYIDNAYKNLLKNFENRITSERN